MKPGTTLALLLTLNLAAATFAEEPPMERGEVAVAGYSLGACIGAPQPMPPGLNFYQADGQPVAEPRPAHWSPYVYSDNIVMTYSPAFGNFVALRTNRLELMTSRGVFVHLQTLPQSYPYAITTNAQGELFAVLWRDGVKLLHFSAAGVLLETTPLPERYAWTGSIDLASDGCSAVLAASEPNVQSVARYNVCTHTPLPDLAVVPYLRSVRYLPNGDVLANDTMRLIQINHAGARIRTYDVPYDDGYSADLFTFDPDGSAVWIVRGRGCGGGTHEILQLDLASGSFLRRAWASRAENIITSISVLDEWRAVTGRAAVLKPTRRRAVR